MDKILKKMRISTLVNLLLTFSGGLAVFLCWFLIKPASEADSIRHLQIYLITVVALAGFVTLTSLISALYFSHKIDIFRHSSDSKASEVMGNDVLEAYEFGKIGLIVLDKNDIVAGKDATILWVSPYLVSIGMNIVDKPISSLSPKVRDMVINDEKTKLVQFDYMDSTYQAEFIEDANLVIIKDVTEVALEKKCRENERICIAYVDVDSYSDINTSDEQLKADVDSTIRKKVVDYFTPYKGLIKSLRPDYFIVLLTRENLQKIQTDRFSIIKDFASEFKQVNPDNNPLADLGLTLSIGVGYGANTFTENDTLARQALDYVIVRGGNSAVVAPYGENMLAYGGNTIETSQATSLVKIKVYARQFLMTLEKASNVLIVPHRNADMDAVASALGVYTICTSLPRKRKNFQANIVYDSQNVNEQTDAAVRQMLPSGIPNYFKDVFVSFAQADDLKQQDTLIVVVDHNRPALSIYPDLYKGGQNKIAVIDHHVKESDSFRDTVFEHIDASSSSASELLTLYFSSYPFAVNVPDYIATLMLSGILLDTQNFLVKTRVSTYQAVINLDQLGADNNKAKDFLKEDFATFGLKSRILANLSSYSRDILIAKAPESEFVNPPILAMAANELTRVDGVRAAFALGYTDEKKVYISGRGNGYVNLPMILQHLYNGGGHFSQAATSIPNKTLDEAESELRHVLDEYLSDASGTEPDKNA